MTQRARRAATLEVGVLTLGVALRLYLAVVNTEANDDHLSVIRLIVDEHRLPRLADAWEGFQPKLYHLSVALAWIVSPFDSEGAHIRIAQLIACAAGIATLFVLRRALLERDLSPSIRLTAFALVALNPKLCGLNAQATNDSFVIFFATVALYQGWKFFRTGGRRAFVLMTGATVLAGLSKGNGLVVFFAVSATLVHALVRERSVPGRSRRAVAQFGAVFVVTVIVLVGAFGSYRQNYQDAGSFFATNAPSAPAPRLFDRTYVFRPGTTSVVDTYFTFRFLDMMEHPTITNDKDLYPLHRTSLWSQVYGRANFVHFDQYPPSWRNTELPVLTIGRLIFVLALLPTALLLFGLYRAIRMVIARRRTSGEGNEGLADELLLLAAVGFVGLLVSYSYTHRDFSTMKAEFLFPGVLAYAAFFGEGAERARAWAIKKPALLKTARYMLVSLLVLYVADTVILAGQLT